MGIAALRGQVAGLPRVVLTEDGPGTMTVSGGSSTRFLNHRTDNDLVATLGTCYQSDFRFFTMLQQEAWDFLRWESMGNAVQAHRTWDHWPYEQHLHVRVNDADVPSDSLQVEQVEQQFDFRRVEVSSRLVKIERLDMMRSPRQWTTALRVTNLLSAAAKLAVEFEWTGKGNPPLEVQPWSDQDAKGFAYAIADGPPILVAVGSGGTWEKKGETAVGNRWEISLKPGEARELALNVHIGWAVLPEYKDKGPGDRSTVEQAVADRRSDAEGFRRVTAGLGVGSAGEQWADLEEICEARRRYLYERMPRLQGFDPEWAGMWSYLFDVIRSGIYPAQANFKDVWIVGDLVVYREEFTWDGPASVQTFCNWDADIGTRALRTYLLAATKADGELSVSSNPYRAYPNPTPQLTNNTMALWDCYQITHDKALLADCYPALVRHVRWLENKQNHTPDGPLMDIGYNIDYGPPSLYDTPTIWPDVQFFLVDHYRKLGQIASLIGKPQEEVTEWSGKSERLAAAIRKYMWDDKNGTFWCVSDKLVFKPVASPIEFHGMATGVPTREQARRLLSRLKDPAKYAPSAKYPYGLPSAPFDSPYFVVKDGWSGTIWPIQTYYTVRGLANYGYQEEAAALAANLFGMMARSYRETGTVWEQYDPRNGKDLTSTNAEGSGAAEVGRGHFVSGIATTVGDTLLRGVFGFERTDEASAFYLTPRPINGDWHGIENLQLSGATRVAIQIRNEGSAVACRLKFSGLDAGAHSVEVHQLNVEEGTRKTVKKLRLNRQNEVTAKLEKPKGGRYLWEVR